MSFLRRKGMHKNCLLLKHKGPIKNFWVIKFFVFSTGFYKIIIADSLACLYVTELKHCVMKETSRSFSLDMLLKSVYLEIPRCHIVIVLNQYSI